MSTARPKSRRGKIARLPLPIREELNRKLRDNVSGPKIRAWLSGLPEVKAILDTDFGGEEVTPQNLSDWRAGGYAEWLASQKEIDQTTERAERCFRLAQAAGAGLGDGFAAMLGGQLMEMLEAPDEEKLERLNTIVSTIRAGDHERRKIELREREASQTDRKLDLDEAKFMQAGAEKTLELVNDARAHKIAAGAGSNAEKIEAMGRLMFGEHWERAKRQQRAAEVAGGK